MFKVVFSRLHFFYPLPVIYQIKYTYDRINFTNGLQE